jgi:hypothetical protein
VAKLSKLLLAMERGQIPTLQGRNLDDMMVDVPGLPAVRLLTLIMLHQYF